MKNIEFISESELKVDGVRFVTDWADSDYGDNEFLDEYDFEL